VVLAVALLLMEVQKVVMAEKQDLVLVEVEVVLEVLLVVVALVVMAGPD
jgi:hypothetical protein